ncbi:hypothetical protein QTP70_028857, partial [Hemibagrus guttatus]
MPGLRNRDTWAPLLLKSSHITSCANGYVLGITARLTYTNTDPKPVEGVFVYPLGEQEVVVGFEVIISGRMLCVEIQSRGNLEESGGICPDCCPVPGMHRKEWACCDGTDHGIQCSSGHLLLDEDLERTNFITGTGIIAPMEVVSIVISTTLELSTLENGAIRLIYPTVLTPIVRGENVGRSNETSATRCFGSVSGKQEKMLEMNERCIHSLFSSPATNLTPYELNFQLLVRGACLLAGLESPTHALRADADPSAQSASATYITLAEEHLYDRHLEIILHLSEPNSPLIILERGQLTFNQYEQQISARRDFIRRVHKEAEPEKKLEFVRKRYHKDVLKNPVLMLNFCPDLLSEPLELQQASRELLFLINCSKNMTQHSINNIKEGMLVAIKSLPSSTMVNITGFGSIIKPLYTSSKPCTDIIMAQVLDYVQKLHEYLGDSNLLRALSWVYHQPTHRSCPRQLFILTDDSLSNVGQVLELVRRNNCNARCFALGLGSRACRRLLHGVAKLTGGRAEFLCDDERLQPKLIKCLKKALEPALTDVRIDWYVPDNMEALLSPNEIPPLYPGSRLIGYCTLYDVSTFKVKKNDVNNQARRLLPYGSFGSVFEVSPGSSELAEREGRTELGHEEDTEDTPRENSQEVTTEFSCAPATDKNLATDDYTASDVRWQMAQTSYVQEQYTLTRCSIGSERGGFPSFTPLAECLSLGLDTASLPHGLERVQPQHSHSLTRWDTSWKQNITSSVEAESGKASRLLDGEGCVLRRKTLARAALAGRSFSSPQGDLDMHRLRRALERVSFEQAMGGRLEESDTETHNIPQGALSLTDSNGFLFPASPLDWDGFTDPESIFAAAPYQVMQVPCRSVIHGLMGSKPMSWEVSMDLCVLWSSEEDPRDTWDEIVHHLAARSVIRDFENMAEKETDIENGERMQRELEKKGILSPCSSKRYRMKAIQTSKSCGIISMYTTFRTTDVSTRKMFLNSADIRHSDVGPGSPSAASSHSQRSLESRSMESFFSSRFNLGRLRPSHTSGRQTPLKPQCLFAESETQTDSQSPDYLPL